MILSCHNMCQTGLAIKVIFSLVKLFSLPKFGNLWDSTSASLKIGKLGTHYFTYITSLLTDLLLIQTKLALVWPGRYSYLPYRKYSIFFHPACLCQQIVLSLEYWRYTARQRKPKQQLSLSSSLSSFFWNLQKSLTDVSDFTFFAVYISFKVSFIICLQLWGYVFLYEHRMVSFLFSF